MDRYPSKASFYRLVLNYEFMNFVLTKMYGFTFVIKMYRILKYQKHPRNEPDKPNEIVVVWKQTVESSNHAEKARKRVKYVGPKLIPFIKAVIIYFLLMSFENNSQVWTTVIKCAPIICLMIFVLLYGLQFRREYIYSHKIFVGLIFSCFGDALLNLNMFAFGMIMFGVAQVFYISAFGWKPLKLWIGLILYIFGAIAIFFLVDNIDSTELLIGLPIYGTLLLTMCWRAIARLQNIKDLSTSSVINNLCAIASILFVLSDSVIAFDKFYTPISYRTFLVMTTYYFAQFGITLSIITSRKNTEKFKSVYSQTEVSEIANNSNENFEFSVRHRRFSDK